MIFGSNTDKSVSLISPSLEKGGVCCSGGAPHPGHGVSDEHCGDAGKEERLQNPEVHSRVQSSPNLSMYRHIMGQIRPSGRKTDYATFKDGDETRGTNQLLCKESK